MNSEQQTSSFEQPIDDKGVRRSILLTLGFVLLVVCFGLIWLRLDWPEASAGKGRSTFPVEKASSISVPVLAVELPDQDMAGENSADVSRQIMDRSPLNNGFLIAKRNSVQEQATSAEDAFSDLWFQDEKGAERLIASEVVSAKFSPDGHKIAYSNRRHELFVETLDGQSLAQIPRAFDPSWCSDSGSISFLAIPSLDYPELQQRSIYNLHSGEIAQAGNEGK